ncbi:hypothetical protein ACYJ1Y_03725 [Natrialbaceae archaeon A-gly3]
MDEKRTVGGLTALFAVTLLFVSRSDDPVIWLLWGTAMVVLSGGLLVLLNRGLDPPQ